jgi:hypothetical protein
MTAQRIAQVFGVVFILVGLAGLALGGHTMQTTMLLGLFPVNVLHNVVHILIGVWGLLAARAETSALSYCKIAGVAYLVLAVIGFVRPDGFGLVPLGGNDVWLHLVLGAILAYVGFAGVRRPATTT